MGTSDPRVLAIDLDTGKVVYTVKTASGMDQLAADTDDGLLFLGESKAGVMGVVDLATHENIVDVKTESGCHTEGCLPGAGVDDGRGAATGVGSALSSWCLVRPAKHRTLLRERGAGHRILVLYALAFKHFEDLLIGDAATFAQVAHLGYGCV